MVRGDRVAVGLTFAVVLVAGFMVFGYRSTGAAASDARELESDAFANFRRAEELRSLQQQSGLLVARSVIASTQGPDELRQDLKTVNDRLDAVLREAVAAADGVDVALLETVEVAHEEFHTTGDRVIELVDTGRRDQAVTVLVDEIGPVAERFDDAIEAFVADQDEGVTELSAQVVAGAEEAQVVVLVVLGTIAAILLSLLRINRQQKFVARRRDDERDAFASSQVRRSRIRNGFEMSQTEADSLSTFREVVVEELPDWDSELLLADSSTAHLHRAVSTNPQGEPACGVASPTECPAIRRGSTLVFDNGTAYDSCPHLRNRDLSGLTAVCVPLKVMGKSIGISHSVTATPPSQDDIDKISEIVQVGGDRLGVLRAFATTNRKASRDPLTGLLNRRTMEEEVQALDIAGRLYSVAFCDLDHFKTLNDTHGHATGDRALRLFSETLTNSTRPTDLCARWGGEEFVVVLPDTDVHAAAETVERLREALSLALMNATVPRFTFSAGIAASTLSFEHATAAADAALLDAKEHGRDRVVMAETPAADAADLDTVEPGRGMTTADIGPGTPETADG